MPFPSRKVLTLTTAMVMRVIAKRANKRNGTSTYLVPDGVALVAMLEGLSLLLLLTRALRRADFSGVVDTMAASVSLYFPHLTPVYTCKHTCALVLIFNAF